LEDQSEKTPMAELEVGNTKYQTRLTGKFANRKPWKRPEPGRLLAIIPGTIQKIMVREGTKVEKGTPILILEAMKMRNEILSPFSGMVKRIFVAEGDRVAKGQLLVEFKSL